MVFSLDMSNFDNCIRKAWYDMEVELIADWLSQYCATGFIDSFFAQHGFEYTDYPVVGELVYECRRSGDLQTGIGNCLAMAVFCNIVRGSDDTIKFFCDGDDTLCLCK